MERIDLLLCLEDERYGERLLAFFTGKKNPALHLELLTAGEILNAGISDQREHVVVLTDSRALQKDSRYRVILLSQMRGEESDSIYLYQKAENIYGELMDRLGGGQKKEREREDHEPDEEKDGRSGVYFLFSPEGGMGALAVCLSQYLGQFGTCLYLNLTGFPLFYGNELVEQPEFGRKGVAELLFSVRQNLFAEKEKEAAIPFGKARMLAPPAHFRDLLDSCTEDWKQMFERLQKECGYQTIVVEAGHLFDSTLEVMELCEHPYFITNDRTVGKLYDNVFEHYIRLEKREELHRRCIWTCDPFESGQKVRIFRYGITVDEIGEDPELMQTVRQWITQMEKEGENDCIIEYDQ